MHSREKVPIIAFDGNHRSGKGTQLAHFSRLLAQKGYDPLVLRGDGTRTGLGQERGDPVSLWWQQFKQFESAHPNPYEAWRIGARTLLAEAAIWYGNMPQNGVILFDRSVVSRAQMTLKEGMRVDAEKMYGLSSDTLLSPEQLELLAPDVTFFLSAPTDRLIARLETDDPKYAFRRRNILNSNEYFEAAYHACRVLGIGSVERVNADTDVQGVTDQIEGGILTLLETQQR